MTTQISHGRSVVSAVFLAVIGSNSVMGADAPLKAPKIWDEKALATWALPITGVNTTPNFYTEAEYYSAPVAEVRTYPVYHPDREPPGYMEWLQRQDPAPLVDPAEIKTDADWVRLGQRVFDELDTVQFRT